MCRYTNLSVGAHGVQKERHATATIRLLAEGAINFPRSYNGLRVRGAHPVDGRMDVVIRDRSAVADDHGGVVIPRDSIGYSLTSISEQKNKFSRINKTDLLRKS